MRKITWSTLILLAVAVAACGGSTQALTGTGPTIVSPMAASTDGAGTLNVLKEGRGKGPDKDAHGPAPTTGTTPATGTTPDSDIGEEGDTPHGPGHGHGHAMLQIEGFSKTITGGCETALTITMANSLIVVHTNEDTEFQRAACEVLADPEATSFHLHIAAKMTEGGLVATYVRMQGPKAEDGEDATTTETPEA